MPTELIGSNVVRDDDNRYLRPWMVGALVWGILSLTILLAYKRQPDPRYLHEIWFLVTLLWLEFGFAGIFHCLRHGPRARLGKMLLVSLLPPLILHFLVFVLGGW